MDSAAQNSMHGSITLMLKQLRVGQVDVMDALFDAYFLRLAGLGKSLLTNKERIVADEEDLAVQVLMSFLGDCAEGKLPPLESRHDLWRLLAKRIRQRASTHRRDQGRQKRGGGRVLLESAFMTRDGEWNPAGINEVADDKLDDLDFFHIELLDCLQDEVLRQIAALVLSGHSVEEIKVKLNKSRATIYRKVKMIGDVWNA